jgi:hypothetical protein
MLPGFRFLAAAIVLSVSMLVFGLGAAALLRSAHEEVASLPIRRAAPEAMFAPAPEVQPRLAMLSVEAAAPISPADAAPAETDSAPQIAMPQVPSPAGPENTVEPDKMAALTPLVPVEAAASTEPSAPTNVAKVETPAAAETAALAPPSLASAPTETAAPQVISTEAAVAPAEPSTTLTPADVSLASTKIATLGGPAVTIETPTVAKPAPIAKVTKVDRKKVKETIKRRRVAARAQERQQVSAPAAPVQAEIPFGFPK